MSRLCLSALILLSFVPFVQAADPAPTANAGDYMQSHIYVLPPGFLTKGDASSKEGNPVPVGKLRILLQDGPFTQYDVSDILKESGIQFPEGASAIYEAALGILVVRNTGENLTLVDRLVGRSGLSPVMQFQIEVSAVECVLPAGRNPLDSKFLTYSELARLPAKSVRLLDRASGLGGSGQRFAFTHTVTPHDVDKGSPSSPDFNAFAPGEYGTKVEVEPLAQKHSSVFDISIACHFRQQTGAADGVVDVNFATIFNIWNDYPVILNLSAIPGQEGTFVAIIARARLVNRGGWHVDVDEKSTNDSIVSPGK